MMNITNKINNELVLNRVLINSREQFKEVLELIKDETEIAFDTENTGLNPKFCKNLGISFSVDGETGYYLPTGHPDLTLKVPDLIELLFKDRDIIVMHNAVYDAGIIVEHFNNCNITEYNWFDTMIAQHLLDENNQKGLKFLSNHYFNYKQASLEETLEGKTLDRVSAHQIYEYACDDAILTFKIFKLQQQRIKDEQLENLMYNIEMPFQKTLLHIRRNGIRFNTEACKQFEEELKIRKKEIVDKIISSTPEIRVQVDLLGNRTPLTKLDSNKDLTQLLYDKLNLPVKGTSNSGAPSVDSDSLKLLTSDGICNEKDIYNNNWLHPIIPMLLEYKEIVKLLNSYTTSLYEKVQHDGRLYFDLLDHGASTGRLSSRNPNLQQLPKGKVRSFFQSSESYKMYVADFSQEELRVCGVITKSKTFENIFKEGKDLHLKVANDIGNLGIPDEDLLESSPNYNYYKEKYAKERFNAKAINFGLAYGVTAYGLQFQIHKSQEECQKIIDDYFAMYPEIASEIEKTKQDIKLKGFTRNLYDRKRRFNKYQGKYYTNTVFRQGFNYRIQGSCADILRIVMNNIMDYINELDNDEVRIIGTVHDEVLYEIKDNENFETHKNKIKYLMENSVKLSIPLTVDGEIGYNYMECK